MTFCIWKVADVGRFPCPAWFFKHPGVRFKLFVLEDLCFNTFHLSKLPTFMLQIVVTEDLDFWIFQTKGRSQLFVVGSGQVIVVFACR